MRILVISIICFLYSGMIMAQDTHTLRVKMTGIKKVKGLIGVCLVVKSEEFMGDCKNYKEVKVTAQEMFVSFGSLKPGAYAITIYHDANENGKLDTNFIGLPKERYGFSNNPSTMFGPPSYKKCLFDVRENILLEIRLK